MIAVAKTEEVEPPLSKKARKALRKQGKAKPQATGKKTNVLSLPTESLLRRAIRNQSNALSEDMQGVIESTLQEVPQTAQGADASPRDSYWLEKWLDHATPVGYTSLIRTSKTGTRTSADYVTAGGKAYLAPVRKKRISVKVKDDTVPFGARTEFRNVADICSWEDIEYEGILCSKPSGAVKTVTRTRRVYTGLTPLGKPEEVLVQFVPLDFSSSAAYEEGKREYLERREYSESVRRKYGKEGYAPRDKTLFRRVPDVLWFLRNPSGIGPMYGGEPWEHGIVDPQAEKVNDAQRLKVIDLANSLRATSSYPISSLRPLKDYYDPNGKSCTSPRYEGEVYDHKAALAKYAETLKDSENGYQSQESANDESLRISEPPVLENVVFQDGHSAWEQKEAVEAVEHVVPYRIPPAWVLRGILDAARRLTIVGRINKSNPAYLPYAERGPTRTQLRSATVNAAKTKQEGVEISESKTPTVTRKNLMRVVDSSSGMAELTFKSGFTRLRLHDPSHLEYAQKLLKTHDKERDALVETIVKMRALQGWPTLLDEVGEVNIDGLLDDFEAELSVESIPREMRLSDVMRSTNWYRKHRDTKSAYHSMLVASEKGAARFARQDKMRRIQTHLLGRVRTLRNGKLLTPSERKQLLRQKAAECRYRYQRRLAVEQENARYEKKQQKLRHRAMQARAHRYTMLSRSQDQRDMRIMSAETTANKLAKRLNRKMQAFWWRTTERFRGEARTTKIPESFQEEVKNLVESPKEGKNFRRAKGSAIKPLQRQQVYYPLQPDDPSKEMEAFAKLLQANGVDPSELKATNTIVAPFIARKWQQLTDHRQHRSILLEKSLAS